MTLMMLQVISKYPVIYMESMNTVLRQELIRYNRLIEVIRTSLFDLTRAIKVLTAVTYLLAYIRFLLFYFPLLIPLYRSRRSFQMPFPSATGWYRNTKIQ